MANRILRDWTSSEKMELLSLGAEVFFTRLIMKADDYGSFHANPKLLKAALFPLKDYTLKQVDGWLAECIGNGLIGAYTVAGKKYIRIVNFGQRLQNMRNAFPGPESEFIELTVTHGESPLETKRNETEEETRNETEAVGLVDNSFDDFWNKYDKKVGRPKSEALWKKIDQVARAKIMVHLDHYCKTDKQYRKDPERYLKNESWNDEIIQKASNGYVRTQESIRTVDAIIESGKDFGIEKGFPKG
jgi:hypothetical protein